MRATSRLAFLLLLVAGCYLFRSKPPPPPPVAAPTPQEPEPEPVATGPQEPFPIQLTLRASDRLNPDERGEPLPTVVMVYQLKSAAKLAGADSEDVYRKPKEVLGEDLLQSEELQLAPGQVQMKTLERDKAAKALAVVALVRRPAGPSWRSIVELPPADQPAELSFVLDGYRVDRQ